MNWSKLVNSFLVFYIGEGIYEKKINQKKPDCALPVGSRGEHNNEKKIFRNVEYIYKKNLVAKFTGSASKIYKCWLLFVVCFKW